MSTQKQLILDIILGLGLSVFFSVFNLGFSVFYCIIFRANNCGYFESLCFLFALIFAEAFLASLLSKRKLFGFLVSSPYLTMLLYVGLIIVNTTSQIRYQPNPFFTSNMLDLIVFSAIAGVIGSWQGSKLGRKLKKND